MALMQGYQNAIERRRNYHILIKLSAKVKEHKQDTKLPIMGNQDLQKHRNIIYADPVSWYPTRQRGGVPLMWNKSSSEPWKILQSLST